MKQLFIHCGLHKTGTTSIQATMFVNHGALLAGGVLFPGVGTANAGQHNLAWELSADHRFDPARGDLGALVRTCAGFPGKIVISSEDFESSLLHPERMARLLQVARDIGARPVFIVYLRDPADYLVSAFTEKLNHGLHREFASVAAEALETGQFIFKQWEFILDHPRLEAALAALPDADIVLRNYHQLAGGSSIPDFIEVIGISPELLPNLEYARVRGTASVLDSFSRFVAHNVPALHSEHPAIQRIGTVLLGDGAAAAVAPDLREALRSRYARVTSADRGHPRGPVYDMARLFSLDTARLVGELYDKAKAKNLLGGVTGMRARFGRAAAEWRDWSALPAARTPVR